MHPAAALHQHIAGHRRIDAARQQRQHRRIAPDRQPAGPPERFEIDKRELVAHFAEHRHLGAVKVHVQPVAAAEVFIHHFGDVDFDLLGSHAKGFIAAARPDRKRHPLTLRKRLVKERSGAVPHRRPQKLHVRRAQHHRRKRLQPERKSEPVPEHRQFAIGKILFILARNPDAAAHFGDFQPIHVAQQIAHVFDQLILEQITVVALGGNLVVTADNGVVHNHFLY